MRRNTRQATDFPNAAVKAVLEVHGVKCPANTGAELYGRIEKDLRARGLDVADADDLFQTLLARVYRFLSTNPPSKVRINNARAWLHRIRRNLTLDFLRRPHIVRTTSCDAKLLEEAANGTSLAVTMDAATEEAAFELLDLALRRLRPRHRQLIWLDLGECLPPDEIQKEMGIRSVRYFRKMKSEAFKALCNAFDEILEDWAGSAM